MRSCACESENHLFDQPALADCSRYRNHPWRWPHRRYAAQDLLSRTVHSAITCSENIRSGSEHRRDTVPWRRLTTKSRATGSISSNGARCAESRAGCRSKSLQLRHSRSPTWLAREDYAREFKEAGVTHLAVRRFGRWPARQVLE